jgi:hypothetical protein
MALLTEGTQRIQQECHRFLLALLPPPNGGQGALNPAILRLFFEGVNGNDIEINGDNVAGLLELCDESHRGAVPPNGPAVRPADAERAAALEGQIRELRDVVGRLSQTNAQLSSEARRLRVWAARHFESVILGSLPSIFDEFRGKRWLLVWRGSSDGLTRADFHRCCDGHANTVTFIRDGNGFIFGGYTPLEWETRQHNGKWDLENNCYKGDDSGTSFIFTVTNPHNLPARKFALKPNDRRWAIYCCRMRGPAFGRDRECEVFITSNADGRTAGFGHAYNNDSGIPGPVLLTGNETFVVNEVEVFQITD